MAKKPKKSAPERTKDPESGLPVLRVGIYARVSTERQAQTVDGSIETQVATMKSYIDLDNLRPPKDHRLRLAGEYVDLAQSAKSLDRPEFSRLKQDIRTGLIDCVMVTKFDRITRSVADFVELDQFFRQHSVTFISVFDQFDTSSGSGRAMQQLLIVFAELERSLTAERTKRQMLDRAHKGLYNGGYRPWGYVLNPERKGVPLVDPEQKTQIMRTFRRYRDFGSLRDLQRWMQDEGITRPVFESRNKVKHGGRVPDVSSLRQLLSNRFYIGKSCYDGPETDGAHEPLFKTDREIALWDAVQKKLAERSTKQPGRTTRGGWKQDAQHIFVLNSLLFCGQCGSALTHDSGTGRDKTPRFYYTCVKKRKHGTGQCSCPSLPAEAIEEAILKRLRSLSLDAGAMKAVVAKGRVGKDERVTTLKSEEARLKKRLGGLEAEIAKFMDVLRSNGANGFASIKDELSKLENEKGHLECDIAAMTAKVGVLEADQVPEAMVVAAYRRLHDLLKAAQPQALAQLLPAIIRKIVWSPATDGSRGGRYQMSLWPTPLIPATLGNVGEKNGEVGSHCSSEWLPHLDSNQEPTD